VLRSLNVIERGLGKAGLLAVRKFFGVILLAIAVKIFAIQCKPGLDKVTKRPRSTMDSIRVSEAPDSGSIPDEATYFQFPSSSIHAL
jgi:hypothetical protein